MPCVASLALLSCGSDNNNNGGEANLPVDVNAINASIAQSQIDGTAPPSFFFDEDDATFELRFVSSSEIQVFFIEDGVTEDDGILPFSSSDYSSNGNSATLTLNQLGGISPSQVLTSLQNALDQGNNEFASAVASIEDVDEPSENQLEDVIFAAEDVINIGNVFFEYTDDGLIYLISAVDFTFNDSGNGTVTISGPQISLTEQGDLVLLGDISDSEAISNVRWTGISDPDAVSGDSESPVAASVQ